MYKRIMIYLVVCIVLSMYLFSCTKKEVLFRFAVTNFPVSFDAMLEEDIFSSIVNGNIFETLVKEESRIVTPSLADYWYSPSDTLMVIKLSESVSFSDGALMTEYDVIASLNRAMNHPRNRFRVRIDSLSRVDDFLIHLHIPKARERESLMNFLASVPIYKACDIEAFGEDYFRQFPIGTGEYFLYSSDEKKIILKKNKLHNNLKTNKKCPDTVEYILEPDIRRQFTLLKEKKVDFVLDIDYSDYQEASSIKRLQLIERLSHYYILLTLNAMAETHPQINQVKNPLRETKVRQAIAHAIDMRTYIKENLSDKAHLLVTPSAIFYQHYPSYLDYYKYDLTLSKSLMKSAGFEQGFRMGLSATTGQYSAPLALFIKKSLQAINIDVDISFYEGTDIFNVLEKEPPASYVTIYGASTNAPRKVTDVIDSYLNYQTNRNRRNYFELRQPRISELLARLNSNDLDIEEEHSLRKELFQTVYDEAMVIPMFQPNVFHVINNKFVWNHLNNGHPQISEFQVR